MQQRDEDELWLEIVANYGDRVLEDPGLDDPGSGPTDRSSAPTNDAGSEVAYGDRSPADPDVPSRHPPDGSDESPQRDTTDRQYGPEPDAGHDSGHREPPDLFAVWADEGRFVPPPPPKMPLAAPPRLFAWLGVFGAPTILLITLVLGIYLPQLLKFGLVAWFVGGFVYLVATMPQEPRDPGDDGARI